MKAAVFQGPCKITIEDVSEPTVKEDGVVIKVKACGICGSDLHGYKHGGLEGKILGHEFAGDIVEIGAGVTGVKIGDRATAMSGIGCGRCYWCQQGQTIRCRSLQFLGYDIPGAFAEYVFIPGFEIGKYASLLPDNVSYQEAATAEPLAVSLNAVTQADPHPDDNVLVIGAGMIGQGIIQILKNRGVRKIIVSELKEKCLILAAETGAEFVIDPVQDNLIDKVTELSKGKGADVVFECAGLDETYKQALETVCPGGKIELVALYESPVTWDPSYIVRHNIRITGCGLRWDIPGAVKLLQSDAVNTRPLITHEFPLANIKEAFETQLESKDAIKVMLIP